MKLLKRTAKVITGTLLVLFIFFFIYANINPPSPGERIYLENPTKIVVFNFPTSYNSGDSLALKTHFFKNAAVYSTVITMSSQTLCVTYDPRKTDRKEMIDYTNLYDANIKERIMASGSKECPVNMLAFKKVKYALSIRK